MALIIEILIGMAFLHFVYERIIAPSLRLRLRLRLFEIRDRLRWLRISGECSDEEFRFLDSSMNVTIRMLRRIDFASVMRSSYVIDSDPMLRSRIEKRIAVIESVECPEYRAISDELLLLARRALLVNNGASFFYLVPIILSVAVVAKITRFIKSLVSIPEGELGKVINFGGMGQLAPLPSTHSYCDY